MDYAANPGRQKDNRATLPLSALSVAPHLARYFHRNRFREQRFSKHLLPIIHRIILEKGSCNILDMGGEHEYWKRLHLPTNVRISILNIERHPSVPDARFVILNGDARHLPDIADGSFDLVHSNSLIEHVGAWSDMRKTAAEIERIAPRYYVQTPNFWFPVDPHSNTPFVHWLPHPVQRRLFSTRARGFYGKAESLDAAMAIIDGTTMIDSAQMRSLFPQATIVPEYVLGLRKSIIAMKL